jgi:ATP synthase protein I
LSSEEDHEKQHMIKQLGVFITIPFVMAVPPILGWLAGEWLDERLGSKPFLMYLFIAIGFLAGFREVYRIIKRFGNGA